jgi:hypothetical protein
VGHFQKSDSVRERSAHPPTTDIEHPDLHVGFVPILLQKSVAPMGGRPFRYERPALIGRR